MRNRIGSLRTDSLTEGALLPSLWTGFHKKVCIDQDCKDNRAEENRGQQKSTTRATLLWSGRGSGAAVAITEHCPQEKGEKAHLIGVDLNLRADDRRARAQEAIAICPEFLTNESGLRVLPWNRVDSPMDEAWIERNFRRRRSPEFNSGSRLKALMGFPLHGCKPQFVI
jgi:hypothetical protein